MQSTIETTAQTPEKPVICRFAPRTNAAPDIVDVSDWYSSPGGGNRYPETPRSQRQYDGDNPFEDGLPWF